MILAAAYFCAAKFGLSMIVAGQLASLVWPPAGIAIAAGLLFGYRVWPALLLGAFLAELSASFPPLNALCVACGNTLETLTGVWLVRRCMGSGAYLEHLRGILGLLFLAAFGATAVGATVGAANLCFSGFHPWASYSKAWLTWWLGDAAGVIIVAPLFLAWGSRPYSMPSTPLIIESLALLAVSLFCGGYIFFHPPQMGSIWVYPYMVFPVVTWVALRLGPRAVSVMILVISAMTLRVVTHRLGLFAPDQLLSHVPFGQALVYAQTYTMVVSMIGLTVCAAMSERRAAEKQSRESLIYLQNVIDHIPDPLLIKNRQHVLVGGNKALWGLLNGTPQELIGRECDALFTKKEEAAAFREKYERVFTTGEASLSEEFFTDYTGKQHVLSFKIAPLRRQGEEPLLVAIARDISALKETERLLLQYTRELEMRNSELDDFAHVAAHDLKEPLRGMNIDAALLLEDHPDRLDAEVVTRLQRITYLSQRMTRLVNDLLRFSRLARTASIMENVNPDAIITDIRRMMEAILQEKNAVIVTPLPMHPLVCDKIGLEEILRNLITNAIRYNDKSSKVVEVGMLGDAVSPRGQESNVFYVTDNGIGIDPQYHQTIFRIFKRLPDSVKYDESGTGMGLTFIKKIIERNNGCIWVSSEPGKGSTFYFTLGK